MTRDELSEMVSLAERLNSAAEPALLATLFAASGSTYRPLGSMMLAGPSMALTAGGVSGGCLEEYLVRRGRALTERQPAVLLRFDSDPDADNDASDNDASDNNAGDNNAGDNNAADSGVADSADVPSLGCGGSIEVLIDRFTADHMAFLRRFAAAHNADQSSTAACLIDSSASPKLAVRRIFWDDDVPSEADPRLESLRECAIRTGRSVHGFVGPRRRALVQYVRPMVRLVILGAGNDARPLSTLARSLGWHVCVADRRARMATRSRFPDADQIVAGDWWTALRSIRFTPQTAVVIMTHSVADDAEILPLLVDRSTAYIGVLGPQRRLRWLIDHADAALPSTFVDRLRGPVGLDLGERSAAGIAVSIVSEILAELNDRIPAPLVRSRLPPPSKSDTVWQRCRVAVKPAGV